jgi:hypothetical protein
MNSKQAGVSVLIWSAVTCYRFGPRRLDAALRLEASSGLLQQVAASKSTDGRGPRRGSRPGVLSSAHSKKGRIH